MIKMAATTILLLGILLPLSGCDSSSVLKLHYEIAITDESNVDPNFDARESLGKEALEALENASDDAHVMWDLQTGEMIIIEPSDNIGTEKVRNTPLLPEGLEIAPELLEPVQPNETQYRLCDSDRGLNYLDFETCYALCVDFLDQYYAAIIEGGEIDLSPYSADQDVLETAKKRIDDGAYQFPKEITDIKYGLTEIQWDAENNSVVLSLALKVTLDYGGGFGTEHHFTIQSQGDTLVIADWKPFEKGQREESET